MIEINQERFFKIGLVCFIVIGFANLANFFLNLKYYNLFNIISGVAGITFNFVLAAFFYYLVKMNSPNIETEAQSEDIDEIIKQIKKNGKGKNKARN